MAASSRNTQYPWGTITPRERLRMLSEKLRTAMNDTKSSGFSDVADRVKAVVRASRSLVDTLEHLARVGLRPMGKQHHASDLPVPAAAVDAAVQSHNTSLADVVWSSTHTLSERYQAFDAACEVLLDLAARAIKGGIAGSPPGGVRRSLEGVRFLIGTSLRDSPHCAAHIC